MQPIVKSSSTWRHFPFQYRCRFLSSPRTLQHDCHVLTITVLAHWSRNKMAAISQTRLPNAFSWIKMYEFWLKFHLILFLRVQLTIFLYWLRQWLGADQSTSHYLTQWWLVYWRIYTSLGLNELGCEHNKIPIQFIFKLRQKSLVK